MSVTSPALMRGCAAGCGAGDSEGGASIVVAEVSIMTVPVVPVDMVPVTSVWAVSIVIVSGTPDVVGRLPGIGHDGPPMCGEAQVMAMTMQMTKAETIAAFRMAHLSVGGVMESAKSPPRAQKFSATPPM